MAATKKSTSQFGFLKVVITILLSTAAITEVVLNLGPLGIDIKPGSSTFTVQDLLLGKVTVGVEKLYLDSKLWSGQISKDNHSNIVNIYRTNGSITDLYYFNGSSDDVTKFPVHHEITIQGEKGKQFKYVVSSLKGVKAAHNVLSGESFGYDMKVIFDDGYSSAKVTKAGTLTVIYIIPSDDWVLNVKLFDPPTNCTNITSDDTYINGDMVLCTNQYFINDTNANGVLFLNTSNITLDCNGSSLIGNNNFTNTKGIVRASFFGNLTIKNCNISGYDRAINFNGGNDGSTIIFNNLSANTQGILKTNCKNDNISFNRITYGNVSVGSAGIQCDGVSTSNTNVYIMNNFIDSYFDGIKYSMNSSNVLIANNLITNVGRPGVGGGGIFTMNLSINATVNNNTVINSSWNEFAVQGFGGIISNNFGYNYSHHCMDFNAASITPGVINNVSVFNNYCEGNNNNTHAVYTCNATNIYFYNNTFNGSYFLINNGPCGQSANITYDNNIFNSKNFSSSCLGVPGLAGFSIKNNIFLTCLGSEVLIDNVNSAINFTNNNANGMMRYSRYASDTEVNNFSVSENTSQTIVNITSIITNMSYTGYKTFTVLNNTFTVSSLTANANEVRLNGTFIFSDITSFSQTLIATNYLEILNGGCTFIPNGTITVFGNNVSCSGVYHFNSTAFFMGANSNISCDRTLLYSDNRSATGIQGTLSTTSGWNLTGCYLTNFSLGIWSNGGDNLRIIGNTVNSSNVSGIKFQNTAVNNTVENNTIYHSTTGIDFAVTNSSVARGNTIYNSSLEGITVEQASFNIVITGNFINESSTAIDLVTGSNHTVNGNRLIKSNNSATTYGIRISGNATDIGGSLIASNNVTGWYYGIRVDVPNSNITDNIVVNSGLWGIAAATSSNNTKMFRNQCYNNSWNCYYIAGGFFGNISNNFADSWYHHGLDSHDDGVWNLTVSYNNFTKTSTLFGEGDCAIFLESSRNGIIYENIINKTYNNNTFNNSGICIENPVNGTDNLVFNNRFLNSSNILIYDTANRTTWLNNSVIGGSPASYFMRIITLSSAGSPNKVVTFINNTFDKLPTFLVASNTTTNIVQKSAYNISSVGVANISITNQLLAYPYNDAKNQTQNLSSNFDAYVKILSNGELVRVGFFNASKATSTNVTCVVVIPLNDSTILALDFNTSAVSS